MRCLVCGRVVDGSEPRFPRETSDCQGCTAEYKAAILETDGSGRRKYTNGQAFAIARAGHVARETKQYNALVQSGGSSVAAPNTEGANRESVMRKPDAAATSGEVGGPQRDAHDKGTGDTKGLLSKWAEDLTGNPNPARPRGRGAAGIADKDVRFYFQSAGPNTSVSGAIIPSMAKMSGVTVRAVQASFARLVKAGYLIRYDEVLAGRRMRFYALAPSERIDPRMPVRTPPWDEQPWPESFVLALATVATPSRNQAGHAAADPAFAERAAFAEYGALRAAADQALAQGAKVASPVDIEAAIGAARTRKPWPESFLRLVSKNFGTAVAKCQGCGKGIGPENQGASYLRHLRGDCPCRNRGGWGVLRFDGSLGTVNLSSFVPFPTRKRRKKGKPLGRPPTGRKRRA